MSRITYGVDGHGVKSYFCNYCELVFGPVDRDQIKHECDRSKPQYHSRDKFHENHPLFKDVKMKCNCKNYKSYKSTLATGVIHAPSMALDACVNCDAERDAATARLDEKQAMMERVVKFGGIVD